MTRLVHRLIPLILQDFLVDMIETEKYGYYHATNEGGYISWYDFAKKSSVRLMKSWARRNIPKNI